MRSPALLLVASLLFAQVPSVEDLIRQLGDDDFEVREKAVRLLEDQGEQARAGLSKAVKESKDAEVRQRADDLLQRLDRKAAARLLAERFAALRQLKTPAFDPQLVRPIVEKKGVLTEKEIWGPEQTYLLTANTTLARGGEVTILPGTVVLLADGVDFRVQAGGKFTAEGQPDKPIRITAQAEAKGQPGHGGKVSFQGNTIALMHAQFRRTQGVRIESGSPNLSQLSVYDTRGDALTLVGPVRQVDAITVREATGTGLVCEGSYPSLGNVLVSRAQIGVQFRGGAYPNLREMNVVECKAAGIQVNDGSYPRIDSGVVLEAETGLRVQDGSYPRVTSLLIGNTREDGVLVEGGSYPSLAKLEVNNAGGVGLKVTGGSYPYLGTFQGKDCKKGDRSIEPGSRIQPLGADRDSND